MSIALFIVGLTAAVLAWHVHHPVRRPAELAVAFFPAALLGGELPLHSAALFFTAGVTLAVFGALSDPLGVVGALLLALAALGPLASWRQATRARGVVARALGRPLQRGPISKWRFVLPFHFHDPQVLRRAGIRRDGERLRADLYRPRQAPASPRPLLIYVHGGGWVLGFRRWQGRLLIRRLVRSGWVAVSVQYRLSPWATWPEHIVDIKRAIVWAKKNAAGWGADPDRIAISGNSAGGHLASLAAFSPSYAAWQPGFEDEDTRVQALVSWYGIYDLVAAVSGSPLWPHGGLRRLWHLLVMKRSFGAAAEAYRAASPATHFDADAPPTLLIHGELDTLVPVASARAFTEDCARRVPGRVALIEVPGAEHAFEVFTSRRGVLAVDAAAQWLDATLLPANQSPD